VNCAICDTRKPKRTCPAQAALTESAAGKGAEICTLCCAQGREETLDCPLSCEYLRTAHRHERSDVEFDIDKAPNRDVTITDAFLEQFQIPLALLATALADAGIRSEKATDYDAREALEATIQKYRGAISGLPVETPALTPLTAALCAGLEKGIEVVRKLEMEAAGKIMSDDQDILRMIVFLQRLEFANNNGRRRSRAFLDFIHGFRMPLPAELPGGEMDLS
jgi:hypothetical protein